MRGLFLVSSTALLSIDVDEPLKPFRPPGKSVGLPSNVTHMSVKAIGKIFNT